MASPIFPDRVTQKEVAEALGVTEGTLAVWRCTGRYSLPWVKIGRNVFYKGEDVKAFIDSRTRGVE